MLKGTEEIDELIKNYKTTGKDQLTQANFAQVYQRAAVLGQIDLMRDMDNCNFVIAPEIKKTAILSILPLAPQPITLLYLYTPIPGISAQMQDEFRRFAIDKKLIHESPPPPAHRSNKCTIL